MKKAIPWHTELVVMDRIPVVCPECNSQVGLRGGISDSGFTLESCPHCGARMEMVIGSVDEEVDEVPYSDESPFSRVEITLGVKGLPIINEAAYKFGGLDSGVEVLSKAVDILCLLFASPQMPPGAIKDLYLRSEIATSYTNEGKRSLISFITELLERESDEEQSQV